MPCQTEVIIEQNLSFAICCHDPDTGILTDADSDPIYRLYEDDTTTPILTGMMPKLDDAGTTGYYLKKIACTGANGFENEKSYTIYIAATVNGITGGISYGFRAILAPLIFLHFYPVIQLEMDYDARITRESHSSGIIKMESPKEIRIAKENYFYANTKLNKNRILRLPLNEEET
jgi:hypothetical protein